MTNGFWKLEEFGYVIIVFFVCFVLGSSDICTTVALLRGTIINRTYGTLKNLYISLFLPLMFGPIDY